jgi:subtilisin family serine protease
VDDVGNGADDDGDGLIDELAGHGTFLAGIIARIAPEAGMLPVKVLEADGQGDLFAVAQGIFHAIEHGADIINLSLTTLYNSHVLALAVSESRAAGVAVVAAAGNSNESQPPSYPAADPNALAVAATDAADLKAPFSNYGEHIALCAPGVDVASCLPGNQYARSDGTSVSASLVSGVAALLRSVNAEAGPFQIDALLTSSTASLDEANPQYSGLLGSGRVDALAALGGGQGPNPYDLDGDGVVHIGDLFVLLAAWGQQGSPADFDGNGTVNLGDLLDLFAHWG